MADRDGASIALTRNQPAKKTARASRKSRGEDAMALPPRDRRSRCDDGASCVAHVLVGEPASTPDQVRGRHSPDHALAVD
jgi:hypothetical protein